MSRFHSLPVAEVVRDTPESVAIEFDIPPPLRETFTFTPGQYLTLRADVDGEDVRRPYSICSGLDDRRLRVGVKKVPGGRFSTFANEFLEPGMTLSVMPPAGHFEWHVPENRAAHHLGFAAGSGITPVLSIAKSVLSRRPEDTFTLFYGNRSLGSVMFLDELHDLKDRHLERLRIVHLFSRERTDVDLFHGRLDGSRIERLAGQGFFEPTDVDAAYLCGPGDMIESVDAALARLGVPADRIRAERFTPASGVAPIPTVRARTFEPVVAAGGPEIEVILDGTRRSFPMGTDQDVIRGAAEQGVELPYSCAGGMCCTCRCKVLEGEVDMAVNYSLEPWELEAGFVLACQSRPKTQRVVLDFDAL
jgi:ring-1,2-phenylacetyl-CoA epoxidase subunit PaaE